MIVSLPAAEVALSHRFRSVSIFGGFLDGARFEFADGLNCLIGARGTGKTTALEFVRYALDALPNRDADANERRRIESLVERNLKGGRVDVEIETKDGLRYIVSRSVGEEPVVLTAQGEPAGITLRSGGVFKADIYSQNEVEWIADRGLSQLSLIDNFAADKIAAIEAELRKVQLALATNAEQILPLKERYDSLSEEIGTLPGVDEKLKGYAAASGGDAAVINQAHAHKALRDRETLAFEEVIQGLQEHSNAIDSLTGEVAQQVKLHVGRDLLAGPNATAMKELRNRLLALGEEVDGLLGRAKQRIAAELQQLDGASSSLAAAHAKQELAFRALLEKHQQAQGQAAERNRLEKLRSQLMAKQTTRDATQEKIARLFLERKQLLQKLSELRDERFEMRRQVADMINDSLSPAIRVNVVQYGNPGPYQRLLEEALKGARIKHILVTERIVQAFWPADLAEAVSTANRQVLMDKAELNRDQAEKTIAALNSQKVLFQLESVELHDFPKIELRDGETYKETTALSTGQKCTAILPILLLDSANPLLVDQPEDNLDNRFIYETVVESVRRIKAHRQLIFVTHNPNIPVLGDAERVFVLDSDGASARKINEGTVDECRENVVTLLEGGEEAFKARQHKYCY